MAYAYRKDNWVLKAFVKANEFHPEVNFEYVPMSQVEICQHSDLTIARKNEQPEHALEQAEILACELMAARLKSWDIVDEDGKPVGITAKTVQNLEPHLAGRMFKIIYGAALSDRQEDLSDKARLKNSRKGSH